MLRAARPLQTLRRSLHSTACRAQQATAASIPGATATPAADQPEYAKLIANLSVGERNDRAYGGRAPAPAGKPVSATTPDVRLPRYILHCRSFRNTIVTLTRENGLPIGSWTGGSVGFKRSGRKTYEAGYQCAVKSFEKLESLITEAQNQGYPGIHIELNLAGFGKGRQAVQTAFLTAEGENIRPHVKYVIDSTPLKIGGTRGKKPRV